MKKILFTLLAAVFFLGLSFESKASHLAGGEIWYEYAGTAQHPNRYDVYLIVYRDLSGVSMCPGYCPATICVRSSCFPNQSYTAPLLPFNIKPGSDTLAGSYPGSIKTPELTDCVNSNSNGMVYTEAYRFYTQIDLPGTCQDFVFSYSTSARNGSSNLVGAGYFYLEAKLNNTLGNNTSPKFLNPAAKAFCVGTPFVWSQAAIEPDGDSLHYDFGYPLGGTCYSPTQYAFQSGYTVSQPMSTLNGINFNNKNGTLRFTASNSEVVVINITIKEYRFDSTYNQWLQVGNSVRDLQVPVVSSADCKQAAQNGPQFSSGSYPNESLSQDSLQGYGIDTISNPRTLDPSTGKWLVDIPVIDYTCFSKLVTVNFDDGVYCETVSPDGTDFRLIGPDSVARPVVGVIDNCRPDLVTKKIDLQLHKALDVDGDYFLVIKNGNDKNTLTNKCGFPLDAGFLIILRVDDCPILDYKLLNVSVENDKNVRIDWEADPTTFSESLFTSWKIHRSNNGQYYPLDTSFTDVYARSYLDTTLSYQDVDGSSWSYAVQLVQDHNHKSPTNTAWTILLEGETNNSENGTNFTWNNYNGWDSAAVIDYEVQMQKWDSTGNTIQSAWAPKDNGVNLLSYSFPWPNLEEKPSEAGIYAFRVQATEPSNANNPFISESNWLYLEFLVEPEKPINFKDTVFVPNVFTPNNDNINDLFAIYSGYSTISLSVYNRWGKMVYEDVKAPNSDYYSTDNNKGWDGRDINSGNILADGTYFYVITFDDEATGKSRTEKGNVSIFSAP